MVTDTMLVGGTPAYLNMAMLQISTEDVTELIISICDWASLELGPGYGAWLRGWLRGLDTGPGYGAWIRGLYTGPGYRAWIRGLVTGGAGEDMHGAWLERTCTAQGWRGHARRRETHSSTKFCCGPMTEPGRQIRIQAIASAALTW